VGDLAKKLLMCGGSKKPLYVDDVFSAYVRTGTGAEAIVTTDIDMTAGYMVWAKGRSGATDHAVYDSERAETKDLITNSTAAETTQAQGLKSVSTTGYTWGNLAKVNTNAATYVDWVFRKAPKFFDVQTVTKSAGSDATVDLSSLGEVGMVTVKRTDSTGSWYTWHRNLTPGKLLYLEQTAAEATLGHITVSGTTLALHDGVIANGTYVVYAWAHDPGLSGSINCGKYVGALQSITNTVTSSGSVSIPAGATIVTLTGKGGTGTSTYHPAVAASGPIYGESWPAIQYFSSATTYGATPIYTVITGSPPYPANPYVGNLAAWGNIFTYTSYWLTGSSQWANNTNRFYQPQGTQTIIGYTYPGSAAYWTYTTGAASTATLEGSSHTYPGGYGGQATPVGPTDYTVSGNGCTLSYTIASGGSLTYTYFVAGETFVELGYEPQFIAIKDVAAAGNFIAMDSSRSLTDGIDSLLSLNMANAETSGERVTPTSTGFYVGDTSGAISTLNHSYVYMAICKPNKPQ